jgi:hypothetical protein
MGPPINWTWLFWLTGRLVDWPGWVNGMGWTLLALVWLVWIIEAINRKIGEPVFHGAKKEQE